MNPRPQLPPVLVPLRRDQALWLAAGITGAALLAPLTLLVWAVVALP